MFSRYKKSAEPVSKANASAPVGAATPSIRPAAPDNTPTKPNPAHMRPLPVAAARSPAEAVAADKDQKRKERLMELKVELHKRLLENLNLAALEKASEASLTGC